MQLSTHLLLFALTAGLACSAAGQDLETFQVPDLTPPVAPDPSGTEQTAPRDDPFVDDEVIPAPMAYPTSTLGLLEAVPVPYPHPGTHLWAGYCDGCETLVHCACPPAWASIDALWLQRQGPDDYRLAENQQQQSVLRNSQFKFDYEVGVRISYGEVVCDRPFEITYIGLHDWNSSIAVDGTGLSVSAVGVGTFADSNRVEANYGSELHSIEFNTLDFRSDCLTLLVGVRYIDVEEDFLLRALNGADEGVYNVTADNRLLGIQGGADYTRGCNGWCYSVMSRVGIFANFTERDIRITDVPPAMPRFNESTDTEFAFVGQLGVGLTRHLGCGIKLRGGYELLWIDGLTLAPEQIGTPATPAGFPNVNSNGDTLYDGGYLGLEWSR